MRLYQSQRSFNRQRINEAMRRMWLVTVCQLKQGAQKKEEHAELEDIKCSDDNYKSVGSLINT